jgi:hypothetical protein
MKKSPDADVSFYPQLEKERWTEPKMIKNMAILVVRIVLIIFGLFTKIHRLTKRRYMLVSERGQMRRIVILSCAVNDPGP